MSLEQKECKKITSSNEKGIDKFKVDALFAFFIDKKKRDGPGRRKRGTVLGGRKEGRSLEEEKNRDGPWRKRKRGTDLKELKVRTVPKIKKKIKRTLHKGKKIV